MKKVLFHITSFEQGGAERVVSNLSNRLSQDGYDVVVTTQWEGKNEFSLDKKVKRIDIGYREAENVNKLIRAFFRVVHMRRAIKAEKPDVVISFLKKNNYRTLLANIGTKIPCIIAVRNDPKSDHVSKADKVLIPLLYPMSDGAVFQTVEQKEFFPESVQRNAEVILNPVHNKYIQAEQPKEKEKVIVHSGRLVAFKNHEMLIRAFLKVHSRHPEYKLYMYGRDAHDGTKEIIEKMIAENYAADYVKLMGGSDELEKLIPKAEIYVLSSHYEGMPNALIEAMAMGMPVVSTDCPCGGPRTLITHEQDGLLVPVDDEDAMADSICRLIEDADFAKKLGANARKISERVNEEAIIAQWKRYIDKVTTK